MLKKVRKRSWIQPLIWICTNLNGFFPDPYHILPPNPLWFNKQTERGGNRTSLAEVRIRTAQLFMGTIKTKASVVLQQLSSQRIENNAGNLGNGLIILISPPPLHHATVFTMFIKKSKGDNRNHLLINSFRTTDVFLFIVSINNCAVLHGMWTRRHSHSLICQRCVKWGWHIFIWSLEWTRQALCLWM